MADFDYLYFIFVMRICPPTSLSMLQYGIKMWTLMASCSMPWRQLRGDTGLTLCPMRSSTEGLASRTSSTPSLNSMFAVSIMTALTKSSTSLACHLQTGDKLTATGRTSSTRMSIKLILHWRMSRGSAKTMRAGETNWLLWFHYLHGPRSSNNNIISQYILIVYINFYSNQDVNKHLKQSILIITNLKKWNTKHLNCKNWYESARIGKYMNHLTLTIKGSKNTLIPFRTVT